MGHGQDVSVAAVNQGAGLGREAGQGADGEQSRGTAGDRIRSVMFRMRAEHVQTTRRDDHHPLLVGAQLRETVDSPPPKSLTQKRSGREGSGNLR